MPTPAVRQSPALFQPPMSSCPVRPRCSIAAIPVLPCVPFDDAMRRRASTLWRCPPLGPRNCAGINSGRLRSFYDSASARTMPPSSMRRRMALRSRREALPKRGCWQSASELPRIRFHDLRHAHATHLLASGVHPKVAPERLGHSRVGVTLDLYSHVLPGMQEDAVSRVDEAMRLAVEKRAAKDVR